MSTNCSAHSGHSEKIEGMSGKLTIIIWLLGVLITFMTGLSGAMFSTLWNINSSVSGTTVKITTLEDKVKGLEQVTLYKRTNK